MGRRFTAASNERIEYSAAAGLNGLLWTFGTIAAVMWRSTDTGGYETILATNNGSGARTTFAISNGDLLHNWDGSQERTAMAVPVGAHVLVGMTKTTGTTTARFHLYRFDTNTWTHQAGSGTNVNSGVLNTLIIGTTDTGGSEPLSGEVFALGVWQAQVMTDSEFERLARGNWLSLAPSFYEQYDGDNDDGPTGFTLGRFPSRETGRIGTTRGVQRPPAGFRMAVQRRRR